MAMVTKETKEVAKGTFWTLLGDLAFKLTSFFYLVFLVRIASQDDIGTFYLALSIITISSLLFKIIFSSFSRYIPYFRARAEGLKIQKLLKLGYSISVFLAIFVAVIVYFFIDIVNFISYDPFISSFLKLFSINLIDSVYSETSLGNVLKILSIYVFVSVFFNLSTILMQSLKRMRNNAIITNIQNISKLVLLTVFYFYIGANLFVITVSFVLSYILAVLASLVFALPAIKELFGESTGKTISYRNLLKEILTFGIAITASSSFWTLLSSSDKIMLAYLLPFEISTYTVAVYTVATSLSFLILLFPSAISSIFFPLASQLYGEKRLDDVKKICDTSMRWILFVTVPFAMVFIIFSSDLLGMFYGDEYRLGAVTMMLFTFGLLIRSLSYIPASILASMRLVRVELIVAVVTFIINIALNFILIPIFGMDGAAFASFVSFTCATLIIFYFSRKLFNFTISHTIFKIIAATLISFTIIYFIHPYIIQIMLIIPKLANEGILLIVGKLIKLGVLAFFFSVCVAIFGAISLLIKSFKHEDLDILNAALRRTKVIPESIIRTFSSIILFGIEK